MSKRYQTSRAERVFETELIPGDTEERNGFGRSAIGTVDGRQHAITPDGADLGGVSGAERQTEFAGSVRAQGNALTEGQRLIAAHLDLRLERIAHHVAVSAHEGEIINRAIDHRNGPARSSVAPGRAARQGRQRSEAAAF